MALQSAKQRLGRRGVMEFLAGRADDANGLVWNQHGDGAFRAVEFFSDDPAELRAFLRCRAHQSHLWIVLIKVPVTEFLRHSLRSVKVHHVEAARRDDGWHSLFGRRLESGW